MVFTCKGLCTSLISIPSKHHYFYPAQDHPMLTIVSSHQTRDEIVNLRESFKMEWSFRSQDGAIRRRQRFNITGKPEKPICAMESEAAGVLVASLLLFITYLFASGSSPGYFQQILPEGAASAFLSICCPALTTTFQGSREGSKAKALVWYQSQSFCFLFFPLSPLLPLNKYCKPLQQHFFSQMAYFVVSLLLRQAA